MALIKCKECGSQVSTGASACPGCGAKPAKGMSRLSIIFFILLTFVVIRGFSSIFGGNQLPSVNTPPEDPAAKAARDAAFEKRIRESTWIDKGKESVLSMLKDKDSAQFKDVYFYYAKTGVPATCGQVNSKNSFGGYSGFKRFVSAGKPELTFIDEQVTDFVTVWNKFCAGERKE